MKTLLLALGLLVLFASACQVSKREDAAKDDDAYRRLAERAAAFSGSTARLMPKEAPSDIGPLLPSEAAVVGTVVAEGPTGTRVFFTMPATPEDAVAKLADALAGGGWKVRWPGTAVAASESPAALPYYVSSLCKGGEMSMQIGATQSRQGSSAEVVLTLQEGSWARLTCGPAAAQRPAVQVLFPLLTAPSKGERVTIPWPSPNLGHLLSTGMTASAVEEHYRAQLRSAGWRHVERGATDTTAWSLWIFEDRTGKKWAASMTVAPPEGEAAKTGASLYMTLEAIPLGHSQSMLSLGPTSPLP